MEVVSAYHPTLWAMGTAGALLLVQLIIADLTGIKARHKPGTPIPVDVNTFLFRSARAHANTNESISAFGLFAVTGILSAAAPLWLNGFAWAYVVCRIGHMGFHYANQSLLRSTVFGISLVAMAGMFITTVVAWLR